MNAPRGPLNADTVDELLSAELDDEFDRAAADHGLTPGEARAALDATPGVASRRAALARARDLLGSRPPLDAIRADALVTAALERTAPVDEVGAARRRQHRFEHAGRVLAAAGVAAAIVAGIVVVSATSPDSGSKSSSSLATRASDAARPTNGTTSPRAGAAFGDVTSAGTLRAKVHARLRLPEFSSGEKAVQGPVPSAAAAQGATGVTGPLAPDRTAASGAQGPTSAGTAIQPDCLAAFRRTLRAGPPVLAGPGTANGRPVYVLVFRRAAAYDVFVVSTADCSVLTRETLRS